jgi:hypothetical protein
VGPGWGRGGAGVGPGVGLERTVREFPAESGHFARRRPRRADAIIHATGSHRTAILPEHPMVALVRPSALAQRRADDALRGHGEHRAAPASVRP